MQRRAFVARIALALALPGSASAQGDGRVHRIGFLGGGVRPPDGKPPAALLEGLAHLGYVEGRNVVFVSRWAEAQRDRFPSLVAELLEARVDLIVAGGTVAAASAARASTTIPIVALFSGDPVGVGLVASLARPGHNVTGVTDQAVELSAKRLELLKEAVPRAARIAVLWNAEDRAMTLRYREIEQAAARLGVVVQPLGVREPDDFGQAFATMDRERPDAMFLVTDALTRLNRHRVLEYANTKRIPAMFEYASFAREGGLLSYGAEQDDLYRRVAVYVDRVVRGASPAELAIEQPTRLTLVVNVRTAAALGLVLPPALLARADEIVR
jgi:putative ABC transport system substrate-binding protein